MNRIMTHAKRSGFTIIEVVLFLAVSSALAAGLLVATGAAIQQQQYRDSVQSYANFLRAQHGRVVSVENEREDAEPCPLPGASAALKGQSECVIVGRYLVTDGTSGSVDGASYSVHPVYALERSGGWEYGLGAPDVTYATNWGVKTRLSERAGGEIGVLMYRNPESGRMAISLSHERYGSDSIGEAVAAAEHGGSETGIQEVCVYEQGWLSGQRQSVFVGMRAGSSDAVAVGSATERCADA